MTSGGVLLHRIDGEKAAYSIARGLLELDRLVVHTFDNDSTGVKGITRAHQGRVYLADNAADKRKRNDMKFTGDVNYAIPSKENPTTDTVELSTPDLLWDATAKRFTGQSEIEITMRQKDGKTMTLNGAVFSVTSDMRNWAIGSGMMSSDPKDVAMSRVASIREDLTSAARSSAPEPTPPPRITLPEEMEKAANINTITTTSITAPRIQVP